jgi:hypothetical protein
MIGFEFGESRQGSRTKRPLAASLDNVKKLI